MGKRRSPRLIVTVHTGNEAFNGGPGAELARILREIADRIERGASTGNVRDVNGNTVGGFTYA